MKNIFLEAAMNYNKMSNSEKVKANNKIRENVKEFMKPRPKTEREKELNKLAKEEKEEYERKKNASILILFIGIITSVKDMDYLY